MSLPGIRELFLRVACTLCIVSAHGTAGAGVVARELERALSTRGTHADTAVIVRLKEPVSLPALAASDRTERDNRLLLASIARTARQRATIEPLLAELGAQRVKNLWIINGLAATLPAFAVRRLAQHPSVERVDLDSFVRGGRSQRTPAPHRTATGGDASPAVSSLNTLEPTALERADPAPTPTWNVAAVHAPELWRMGYTGRGVVVASMDTGVDLAHPDLRRKWRGGANSWFDPHGQEREPYDALGHGTQAIGVVLGGRGLGVAPDARWIAVRLFDSDGRAAMSDIHLAFQWLMDPDGDPATVDAPDIVNASWTLSGRATGACIGEFGDDIQALRSAGIAVVFAAGNDGPADRTSSSPANNPGALSIGALDRDLGISRQSSRGPSACDGALFPTLTAPGVAIGTTDLSHGGVSSVAQVSGTSLAAPHASGVLALLMSAFPHASVNDLQEALVRGARDLGSGGADNRYGHGLIDAQAAFERLRAIHVEASLPRLGVAAPMGLSHDGRH